ncbi:flagellar hook-associated protein FlgK [Galbitalea soli]|uniref:Flagellar hook-associated protein 1 n=1 Tax=Galbitalea soli TaxID=1268042 RepID=A0A7C9TRP9_9MICO|nr:flagellar hook-associated protein FlgK [Galbitalea soli]NEM91163.1 flagellar hook-associated protein FlgK [Galbitalea soli]NYJ29852.1 flagellar hook-associated protein 1 FlgK [Galbitalea soli]
MSTFSGLTSAYTGLNAAQQQLNVIGQNITNANTEGYVRQRVTTSAIIAANGAPIIAGGPTAGQGVSVDGIARLANALLDGQVRTTGAANGYWSAQSSTMDGIEASLGEPSDTGISTSLQAFWTSWQNLSNRPGDAAATSVVLQTAGQVIQQVADGYTAVTQQWSALRTAVNSTVADVNQEAQSLAALNDQIRQTQAAGGTANDLTDQRDLLVTKLAAQTGGTARDRGDGMIDFVVGGNALVSGQSARTVVATGAVSLDGAATAPVQLEFTDKPGQAIALTSGSLTANLGSLQAANATGTGGAIAEAAASYNALATSIATSVNAIHSTGASTTGATGLDFFGVTAGLPPALGLTVIPTDASGVAVSTPGAGTLSGDIADRLSQLATSTTGPDSVWSTFVVRIGNASRAATQQATITAAASANAVTNQQSEESVNTDEETTNMLMFQHAYQAAARVMTTVDDMLDTLINKTGLVGR